MSVSKIIQVGQTWPAAGFSQIRRLFIFGDSYSAVGWDLDNTPPTAAQPLGIRYPGLTWNEEDRPNWVGHLITKYCAPPRYNPNITKQDEEYNDSPLLVYDYAVGGDTVDGVQRQVLHEFLPNAGKHPPSAPWTSSDSLFMTWVGINDCANSLDHTTTMEKLFALQEKLYMTGARNFAFIDVPPINRSPAVPAHLSPQKPTSYENWNESLLAGIVAFCAVRSDITALLFSSFTTFNKILDNPMSHGFQPYDTKRAAGEMWVDHLHPTSKVHDIIAKDLSEFLGTV